MLKRVAIFMCITAVCVAGEVDRVSEREFERQWRWDQERHKKLASKPTPREWRAGAVWRFVTTPLPGKAKPASLTFRVTDQSGVSCLASSGWKDVWRKFVLVDGKVPFGSPIYQVEGRALQINLSGDMCDAYDIIEGVFTDGDFMGQRTTFGLGAPREVVGAVRGSCVQR
jgi:hypothetical protein